MNEISIAKHYIDAWNGHDSKVAITLFDKNAMFSDPSHDGLAHDLVPELIKNAVEGFPDVSFDVVNITSGSEGLAVLEWVMRGTNTGSAFGVPPTGKTIAVPGVDIMHVQNGKISSLKSYFDDNTFAKQLGLA